MLNLDTILARLDAMTPSDFNALLKEALTESEIPYDATSGTYTIEEMLPIFDNQSNEKKIEIDLSMGSDQATTYKISSKHTSFSFDYSNATVSSLTYSIPAKGSLAPLRAA